MFHGIVSVLLSGFPHVLFIVWPRGSGATSGAFAAGFTLTLGFLQKPCEKHAEN